MSLDANVQAADAGDLRMLNYSLVFAQLIVSCSEQRSSRIILYRGRQCTPS
jgi:hypothetical protein